MIQGMHKGPTFREDSDPGLFLRSLDWAPGVSEGRTGGYPTADTRAAEQLHRGVFQPDEKTDFDLPARAWSPWK